MVVQWLSRVQLLASFPLECLQQARAGRHCAPRLRVCAVCRLCRVWSRDTDMHCLLLFSRSVMSDSLPPMGCSPPGPPVHHQLPEFTQTHVHRVCDAIQPSHLLSSSSPLAPNSLMSSIRVFSNESTLRMRWPKYWSFSLSIIPSKEHPTELL